MSDLLRVLDEVAVERERQDARWGEQNYPDVVGTWLSHPSKVLSVLATAEAHLLPSASAARTICNLAFGEDVGAWAHIAVEELAEAVEAAALGDTAALRTELVQTAAVLVAWIQAIDRRAVSS
jgi:hypothetical protein